MIKINKFTKIICICICFKFTIWAQTQPEVPPYSAWLFDAEYVPIPVPGLVPLYGPETPQEPPTQFETDEALVTRFADRGRDRHAKENHFSAYDHYLSFYWEDRTIDVEIIDYVAKGGNGIRMNVYSPHKLSDTEAENRWFYIGRNTLAEFCDNGTMEVIDIFKLYKIPRQKLPQWFSTNRNW